MNLWGRQSPDYTTFKQDLERQFMTEDVRFSPPTISRVNVEVEKVSLRATVNLTAVNLKSNQKREQRMARNMAFIVEDGKWKIWRCAPAENDLAEALAQARTEEERAGLLAEDKELVTVELVQAVIEKGNRLYLNSEFDQAVGAYGLSQGIAERIGDKAGIARALNNIASIYNIQGNYGQALEYLQRSLAVSESQGDNAGIA